MAEKRSNDDQYQSSVSLPGVLAMLCGVGMLLAYWKFGQIAERLNQFERMALVGVTSFLALWGVKQIVDARFPPERRRRNRRRSRSGGQDEPSLVASISWVGILLILAGIELLLTLRLWVPDGATSLALTIAGVLCIAQGVRRIIATLMPGNVGRRPRYRVALPRSGQMYLLVMTVLLIGSLLGHSNMLMLVFAMMVGPFVLNGWVTFSMLKRTSVSRRLPATAIAGEPFTVEVSLENRKLLLASSVMMAVDQIENDHEFLEARALFPRVPARSSRSDSYRIRLMQRGVYHFGPLHLATRFPLGVVERRLIFDCHDDILVFPHVGQLSDAWKRGRSLSAEMVDRRSPARGSFHDEFHGMRDYRPGDSPRSIHWRTSVRRNGLTVREHEQTRSHDLMVLLDLWEPASPDDAHRERVELAVSFAATLAVDHMRHSRNAHLEVAVSGREFSRWGGRTGPTGVDSLLNMLAMVSPSADPNIVTLTADAEARRTSSMRVILLTTRPRPADVIEAIRLVVHNASTMSLASHAQVVAVGPDELAPYFIIGEGIRHDDETAPPDRSRQAGHPIETTHLAAEPAGGPGSERL